MKKLFKASLLLLVMAIHQAGAGVVPGDDPVFGAGSLTIDTDTNLAWLDISFTDARGYADVSSELGIGGDFEGFRIATEAEVLTFFSNAGIPDLPIPQSFTEVQSIDNFAPIQQLLASIGTTNANLASGVTDTDSTVIGFKQLVYARLTSSGNGGVGLSFTDPNAANPNAAAGVWLVKEAPNQTLNVSIDIKPGSDPNSINLCSNGAVPVAIFGSSTLDVTNVNTENLRFAEAAVKVVGKKDPNQLCGYQDINGDLISDLVCHFVTTDIAGIDGESTTATVNGELFDGTPIEGTDSVNIVKDTCN